MGAIEELRHSSGHEVTAWDILIYNAMLDLDDRVKALEHPEVKVHDVEKYYQEPTKDEVLVDHIEGLINTYLGGNDGIDESIGDLARRIIAAVRAS